MTHPSSPGFRHVGTTKNTLSLEWDFPSLHVWWWKIVILLYEMIHKGAQCDITSVCPVEQCYRDSSWKAAGLSGPTALIVYTSPSAQDLSITPSYLCLMWDNVLKLGMTASLFGTLPEEQGGRDELEMMLCFSYLWADSLPLCPCVLGQKSDKFKLSVYPQSYLPTT